MQFDTLWEQYENKKQHQRKRHKLIVTVCAVCLLISGVGVGATQLYNVDRVDYAFEKDPSVVGRWETVDFVATPEAFSPSDRTKVSEDMFKAFAFISTGEILIENGGVLYLSGLSYTKDHVLHTGDMTDASYTIKDIDHDKYMFLQWKSGDYTDRLMKPKYYVLKQVDALDRVVPESVSVRHDAMPTVFEVDEQLVGEWTAIDYITDVESYVKVTDKRDRIPLNGVTFKPNGQMTMSMKHQSHFGTSNIEWTKGVIYLRSDSCSEGYVVKTIEGQDLLFFPWLNGDVVYRGDAVKYYVLKKK